MTYAQTQWQDAPEAIALLDKAVAHCAAYQEFPLDIEAALEKLRDETLTDLWVIYGREYDQDGFDEWHGQPTVEEALQIADERAQERWAA